MTTKMMLRGVSGGGSGAAFVTISVALNCSRTPKDQQKTYKKLTHKTHKTISLEAKKTL
jgi:hypothetical protein